ncbi:hypothetical protein V1511DRAFT_496322 [Dipodascopsis uninucleata]
MNSTATRIKRIPIRPETSIWDFNETSSESDIGNEDERPVSSTRQTKRPRFTIIKSSKNTSQSAETSNIESFIYRDLINGNDLRINTQFFKQKAASTVEGLDLEADIDNSSQATTAGILEEVDRSQESIDSSSPSDIYQSSRCSVLDSPLVRGDTKAVIRKTPVFSVRHRHRPQQTLSKQLPPATNYEDVDIDETSDREGEDNIVVTDDVESQDSEFICGPTQRSDNLEPLSLEDCTSSTDILLKSDRYVEHDEFEPQLRTPNQPRFLKSSSSGKKALQSATLLAQTLQRQQYLTSTLDTPSTQSAKSYMDQNKIVNTSNLYNFKSGMAGIVSSWVLKAHSDIQLNMFTETSPMSFQRRLTALDSRCHSSPSRALSWTSEIWKVVIENRGYIEGNTSYAGYTFTKLQKQLNSTDENSTPVIECWALLFDENNKNNDQSTITTIMLKNKNLKKDMLLRLYKPLWYLKLTQEEYAGIEKYGYSGEVLLICIGWQILD